MPFLCKFCVLFFSFCFSHLPSMAPQLPSCGDVTFSVCCLPLFKFLAPFFSEDQAQAPPLSGLLYPARSQTRGWRTLAAWNQISLDLSRTFRVPFLLFLWDLLSILLGSSFFCDPSLSLLSRVLAFCSCFSYLSMPFEGSVSLGPCS